MDNKQASTAHPPAHRYDRRESSRVDELPEPTHDFLFLAEQSTRRVTWLIPLLTIAISGAFAVGSARLELSGKADKSELALANAKLDRLLDVVCDRATPKPRACAEGGSR
ncbi:MAG: hypothetical protein H0X64_10695 [Gemmatimonadaceae bacterium]|nr:hypothetical protein [Gemmatimonadaceae bacterium]